MKPSKIDNILNYDPPLEDTKAASLPFTYCQPLQSTFDPECAVSFHQNPFLLNRRGEPSSERPLQGSGRGFSPLPPAPLPNISASPWGDSDRRSLCNSTWRGAAPGAPRPPLPGLEDSQSSLAQGATGVGAYSRFPPKHEIVFRAVRNCHPDVGSPLQVGNCPGPVQKGDRNRYFPLMLSPLGRSVNQNISKTVSPTHGRPMVCNFCKNNKEVPDIYLNHYLYDPETKVLSCPVLRKHVCEICGKTGDQAHTLQYCPVNRERGLQAKVPVLLKTRTITNSTGKIRRN